MSKRVDPDKQQPGPQCLAGDALVSYLYDECAFEERLQIEQHLTSCELCAAELDGLGGVRVQLTSWTPPHSTLGFQISAVAATSNVVPFTPAPDSTPRLAWWRQPLPAWGQAVAATVLFGLGMAAGSRQVPVAPVSSASSTAASSTAVSASELANLEAKLRREMAALRTPSPAPVVQAATARLDDAERDALMRQVRLLVRESEDRQQEAFTIRAAQVARDAEIQRRVDVANLRQTFEQMQGSTSEV